MAKAKKNVNVPEEGKEKKQRVFRPKEERLSEIEKKIKYHKECIEVLEKKKANIEKGRSGGTGRAKTLKRLISDAKLSDSELIEVMTLGDEEKIRTRLNEIIEEKMGKNEDKDKAMKEAMSQGNGDATSDGEGEDVP